MSGVDWDAFLSPMYASVTQDAKLGIKIVDVMGKETLHDWNVPVVEAIAEAEKRGWRAVRSKDRVGLYNDHHLAQQLPHGIFSSRNSFINYDVKELKNLCGILGISKRGKKITLMTKLANKMDLPIDEVALPAEEPAVIEPEPVAAPEPVKASTPAPIPAIKPPARDTNIISTMLTCPYGRARPLVRQDLFADGRYSGWSEPIKGRTMDNVVTMLVKMGTFEVTHGPSPYTDQEGRRWKCVVLAHSPRTS